MVAASTYGENLFIGTGINLTIVGAGATTTKIDGGYNNRVIAIEDSGAVVSLSNLTIRRGIAAGGGGILNWGTLTISIDASNPAGCTRLRQSLAHRPARLSASRPGRYRRLRHGCLRKRLSSPCAAGY